MENFNSQQYRDNLAKDLKEIRKDDSAELASKSLDVERETSRYKEAKNIHEKKLAYLHSDLCKYDRIRNAPTKFIFTNGIIKVDKPLDHEEVSYPEEVPLVFLNKNNILEIPSIIEKIDKKDEDIVDVELIIQDKSGESFTYELKNIKDQSVALDKIREQINDRASGTQGVLQGEFLKYLGENILEDDIYIAQRGGGWGEWGSVPVLNDEKILKYLQEFLLEKNINLKPKNAKYEITELPEAEKYNVLQGSPSNDSLDFLMKRPFSITKEKECKKLDENEQESFFSALSNAECQDEYLVSDLIHSLKRTENSSKENKEYIAIRLAQTILSRPEYSLKKDIKNDAISFLKDFCNNDLDSVEKIDQVSNYYLN